MLLFIVWYGQILNRLFTRLINIDASENISKICCTSLWLRDQGAGKLIYIIFTFICSIYSFHSLNMVSWSAAISLDFPVISRFSIWGNLLGCFNFKRGLGHKRNAYSSLFGYLVWFWAGRSTNFHLKDRINVWKLFEKPVSGKIGDCITRIETCIGVHWHFSFKLHIWKVEIPLLLILGDM